MGYAWMCWQAKHFFPARGNLVFMQSTQLAQDFFCLTYCTRWWWSNPRKIFGILDAPVRQIQQ
jgi:hypothetical protein